MAWWVIVFLLFLFQLNMKVDVNKKEISVRNVQVEHFMIDLDLNVSMALI